MSRILIPLLVLVVGCARVVPLRSDAEIDALNRQGAEQFSVVTLENGKSLSAHRLELRADTLRIHHFQPIPADVLPLSDIRSIRFGNHWEGTRRGVLVGGATAFVVSLGWALTTGLFAESFIVPGPLIAIIVVGLSTEIGVVAGSAAGYVVGDPCRYEPVAGPVAAPDSLLLPGTMRP